VVRTGEVIDSVFNAVDIGVDASIYVLRVAALGIIPAMIYVIGALTSSAIGIITRVTEPKVVAIAYACWGTSTTILLCEALAERALFNSVSPFSTLDADVPLSLIHKVVLMATLVLPAISTPTLLRIFFPGISVGNLELVISLLSGLLVSCLAFVFAMRRCCL